MVVGLGRWFFFVKLFRLGVGTEAERGCRPRPAAESSCLLCCLALSSVGTGRLDLVVGLGRWVFFLSKSSAHMRGRRRRPGLWPPGQRSPRTGTLNLGPAPTGWTGPASRVPRPGWLLRSLSGGSMSPARIPSSARDVRGACGPFGVTPSGALRGVCIAHVRVVQGAVIRGAPRLLPPIKLFLDISAPIQTKSITLSGGSLGSRVDEERS